MDRNKFFADLLSGTRAIIALGLIFLGIDQGAAALEMSVFLILIAWISDYFDGELARKSPRAQPSWLGLHDLEIDMLASIGLLFYLVFARFIAVEIALFYLSASLLFFRKKGISKAFGSLFQLPVYAYFLSLAYSQAYQAFLWVLGWVILNLAFTWRRFVYQVIPSFFRGLRNTGPQE